MRWHPKWPWPQIIDMTSKNEGDLKKWEWPQTMSVTSNNEYDHKKWGWPKQMRLTSNNEDDLEKWGWGEKNKEGSKKFVKYKKIMATLKTNDIWTIKRNSANKYRVSQKKAPVKFC